jgi:ATP-binding cassette, subfamily B, bacterial PglK
MNGKPKPMRRRWRQISFLRDESLLFRCLSLLPKSDHYKLIAVLIIQVINGLLDLIGVGLVGVLGALTIVGIQSESPTGRIAEILSVLQVDDFSFQSQAAIIGMLAAIVFLVRTWISVIFTRKSLFFLSRRAASISSNLIYRLLNQSILDVRSRTTQASIYALTNGVVILTVGVIGTLITIFADMTLLIIISIGLIFVDPLAAISTFAFFSSLAILLFKLMSSRAKTLGLKNASLSVYSTELVEEVLTSYHELQVRGRKGYYAEKVESARYQLASTLAEMQFLPSISKYVIESLAVVGTLLIAASQFLTKDAIHAVGTLSVFLAAGTRITPAILRVQQGAVQVRSNLGAAEPTFEVIDSLEGTLPVLNSAKKTDFDHQGFVPEVKITNLSFHYPSNLEFQLNGVNLEISAGEVIALVGPSGAGKSTLADLILGVLEPTHGAVKISGLTPKQVIERWSGCLAYVPQDVVIANRDIRQNVALGFSDTEILDERVEASLEIAQLAKFISDLPEKTRTKAGERGSKLSGGQRQRLGIARALYTNPRLIVLDEATSSLDGTTENDVSQAILSLKGNVTLVIIAHRLSTVKQATKVVYLDNGKIIAQGSFNEVRTQVKDFDEQAGFMGL